MLRESPNADDTLKLFMDRLFSTGFPAAATAAGVALGAAVVYQASRPDSQIFGPTIVGGNNPSEVALTYDDGPNGRMTMELLELLARHNARATFFLVGQHVQRDPDTVRAVHAAGHLIGNHTWTHPWLVHRTAQNIREELTRCSAAIEDIVGEKVRYFRPPHGARRWAVLRIARELGMETVQWNAMGIDWKPIGPASIVANIDRGMRRAQARGRGTNILLHDGDGLRYGADRSDTLRATESLLQRFGTQGLRPVTVDAWR